MTAWRLAGFAAALVACVALVDEAWARGAAGYDLMGVTLGADMRAFIATQPVERLKAEYCQVPAGSAVEVDSKGVMRRKPASPAKTDKPYLLRVFDPAGETTIDLADLDGAVVAGGIERHADRQADALSHAIARATDALGPPDHVTRVTGVIRAAYWGGQPGDGAFGDIAPAAGNDDTLEIYTPGPDFGTVVQRLQRHSLGRLLRPAVCPATR